MSAGARLIVALALGVLASDDPSAASCRPGDPEGPRTLVLAVDGVAYRIVERAREEGAFGRWQEPVRMISTFPSMTNVSFAEMLRPFGAGTIGGYERRHYDREINTIRSHVSAGLDRAFDWREVFQVQSRSLPSKVELYLTPGKLVHKEMDAVEDLVLKRPSDVMLALISGTDFLAHFEGDEDVLRVMLELEPRIERLRQRHEAQYGRPLEVVLLSDHGNTSGKVRSSGGVRGVLRAAGLEPAKRISGPMDVVPVTYGVVGYGVLFTEPASAPLAARAVLKQTGVNLAAWISAEGELRVLAPVGEAIVRFRQRGAARELAYESLAGDPLRLAEARRLMQQDGLLDAGGYAAESAWFERTALGEFPHALGRLVDSLSGSVVRNAATVIFSYSPGHAWGVGYARLGSWLRGGRLEGTHGGLDRESTFGVFIRSGSAAESASRTSVPAVRASEALAEWAGRACIDVSLARFPCACAQEHGPSIAAH